MNVEALQIIELDAARAPAPMVDHYIQLVRNSLAECTADTADYANALLLKLALLVCQCRNVRIARVLPPARARRATTRRADSSALR